MNYFDLKRRNKALLFHELFKQLNNKKHYVHNSLYTYKIFYHSKTTFLLQWIVFFSGGYHNLENPLFNLKISESRNFWMMLNKKIIIFQNIFIFSIQNLISYFSYVSPDFISYYYFTPNINKKEKLEHNQQIFSFG